VHGETGVPPVVERRIELYFAVKLCPFAMGLSFFCFIWLHQFFMGDDNVEDKFGDFLVSFRRGEVIGMHNNKEVELNEICTKLGGLDRKYFDPYKIYSKLADHKLLVRVAIKNLDGSRIIFFFYPVDQNQNEIRREMINLILDGARNDYKLFLNGYAVVINQDGNLKLAYIEKSLKNTMKRKKNA
jgi:hypothetical protein